MVLFLVKCLVFHFLIGCLRNDFGLLTIEECFDIYQMHSSLVDMNLFGRFHDILDLNTDFLA